MKLSALDVTLALAAAAIFVAMMTVAAYIGFLIRCGCPEVAP